MKGDHVQKKRKSNESNEVIYGRIFNEILDNVVYQTHSRFSDLESFIFFVLLNFTNFAEYKRSFPKNLFSKLMERYGSNFDSIGLKNKLIVLYSSEDQHFYEKSVSEIVKIMNERDLLWEIPELYK